MNLSSFPIELLAIIPFSIAAFLVLLTIIVFFHEYGHFSMARLLGVKVDVFSIGFGKPLARWTDRHGTEWRIASLPFGGYVKFFGDATGASNPSAEVQQEAQPATTQFPKPGSEVGRGMTPEEKKVCFHFKPVWARALIVAAGPFANFILATAIFAAIFMWFGSVVVDARVGAVVEGSAAAEAGFEQGDLVLSVNGRKIGNFDDLAQITMLSSGEDLKFQVDRNGEAIEIVARPRRVEDTDAFGNKAYVGRLGLQADAKAFRRVEYGPLQALGAGVGKVWDILETTVRFLGRLVLGKEDSRQLGGPLKMAQYAGQSAMSGFDDAEGASPTFWQRLEVSLANFINLAAFISVSIGFLNLLPVPVLDGGHLMYYAYEAAAGRPLGARAQAIGFQVGIILLATFMLFVTWNDISNLLSLKNS